MKTALLSELVTHARNYSPFFAELYKELPVNGWSLTDLPVINPVDYWQQSSVLENWPVLTALPQGGHVFKTGGTTSDGRLSVFTHAEWHAFVCRFGQSVAQQLQPGDRVANLFFAGDLYTSFLFIHGALSHSPIPILEYPFTSVISDEVLAEAIVQQKITVLAGLPIQLVRFANLLQRNQQTLSEIRSVLYGGESLFAEQLALLYSVFPNAQVASIGCASVDAGLIGTSTPDCQLGEHRVFNNDSLIEIIDETSGTPINEIGRPGLLVVTNLQRRLMPIIRYPSGDMACWCEAEGENRKFKLQGRANLGYRIRLGSLSLFPGEFETLLAPFTGIIAWQLILERTADIDALTLQVAGEPSKMPASADVHNALLVMQPAIAALCEQKDLRLEIVCCQPEQLLTHPRSGKLMRVVDKRTYCH